MGQKVHPYAFRLGVTVGWKSRWFASKQEFAQLLVEDEKIRRFIKNKRDGQGRPKYPGIDSIEIERTRDEVKVHVNTCRPGLIIGKKGQEVELLQEELQRLTGRRINLKINEISNEKLRAQLVAEDIAAQLSRRAAFRRTVKRAMEEVMEAGAKGIKIRLAGRLGGAEMARREKYMRGTVPLSTLQADIDYGFTEAKIPQGQIGVKVWIYRGLFSEGQQDGNDAQAGQASKGPKRTHKR